MRILYAPVRRVGCWVSGDAPSTLGTFLRSFTWGHVRQLDKAAGEALGWAWAAGAGPGKGPVTIAIDSTICEVSGKAKDGTAYGHAKKLGYHPLVAVRAESGEIVACRLRGGSSQRGNVHFAVEAVARTRRAGASGPVPVWADAGFWSYDLIKRLDRLEVQWSITIPLYSNIRATISNIDEKIGHLSATPKTAKRRSRRPPSSLLPAVTNPNYGPTGGTTRSLPTPTLTPSKPTNTTADTPPPNSPSATAKKPEASPTAHR